MWEAGSRRYDVTGSKASGRTWIVRHNRRSLEERVTKWLPRISRPESPSWLACIDGKEWLNLSVQRIHLEVGAHDLKSEDIIKPDFHLQPQKTLLGWGWDFNMRLNNHVLRVIKETAAKKPAGFRGFALYANGLSDCTE